MAADEVAAHRVQGAVHLDVVIPVHLRPPIHGQVIRSGRRGQQQRRLLEREHLRGARLDGAVDAHPRHLGTPALSVPLRVGEVAEGLAGPEAPAHVGHGALDPRLVGRGGHPGGVDHEPARLGVLDERVGQPRRDRVRLGHDGPEVVGDSPRGRRRRRTPGGLAAGDHHLGGLRVGQPHEHAPGEHRGEDQHLDHPAATPCPILEQPRRAKSICTSPPGSPSATRTVVLARR